MKDSFGEYSIITEHEGKGGCFWCGGAFPDKRKRRFCKTECSDEYHRHYWWGSASAWALERANYTCQKCGEKTATKLTQFHYSGNLVVHHIMPLNGSPRIVNALNRPDNLIVLCRKCHGIEHSKKAKAEGKQGELFE